MENPTGWGQLLFDLKYHLWSEVPSGPPTQVPSHPASQLQFITLRRATTMLNHPQYIQYHKWLGFKSSPNGRGRLIIGFTAILQNLWDPVFTELYLSYTQLRATMSPDAQLPGDFRKNGGKKQTHPITLAPGPPHMASQQRCHSGCCNNTVGRNVMSYCNILGIFRYVQYIEMVSRISIFIVIII